MQGNLLFPIFLRLDKLKILVVGGGHVGLEKISSFLKNSPNARIHLVAPEVHSELEQIAISNPDFLKITREKYHPKFLKGNEIIIAATCITELNYTVWEDSKKQNLIVNVADTPELCDFYMCSVVKKGDLKIGISSNGLSPTLTKRLRELLEDVLPEEIDQVLRNLKEIRDHLKGDFEYKVQKMNEITSVFKEKNTDTK
jgi:precorrin-2 dehydrogenase/sirohydrochlorin ferrochelatase